MGAVIPALFVLLVNINPAHNVHILWFVFPAGINALTLLVSFGVSGIYLSFLLTVTGPAGPVMGRAGRPRTVKYRKSSGALAVSGVP